MLVHDEEGTEWLGIIVIHPITGHWSLQVILKDGVPVFRQLVKEENDK
jgi:hypothetical protein